jgi:Carbohydrate esterase, sialic acid-specific acetylesterase
LLTRYSYRLAVVAVVACGSDAAVPKTDNSDSVQDASTLPDVYVQDAATASDAALDAGPQTQSKRFDYWGLVHTGQSLSVGAAGGEPSTLPQPYGNLQLLDETGAYNDTGKFSFAPLRSPIRPLPYSALYPGNIAGETPAEGMANQISALTLAAEGFALSSIPSVVGQGGMPMSVINKQPGAQYPAPIAPAPDPRFTSSAYWASLFEVTQLTKLATNAGKRYGVGAVVMTHGESDAYSTTQTEQAYADALYTLLQDYRADLTAITKQATTFPMLLTQQNVFPAGLDVVARITLGQAVAADQHPNDIVLVGPKYQYEYAADRVHLTAPAYERLGEKYAQVFYQHVLLGRAFRPLAPTAVSRNGLTITVAFNVPSPPLAFDDAFPVLRTPSYAWRAGRGFEVRERDGSKRTIVDAKIVGANADSVQLTLDTAPGADASVSYAMTQASSPGTPSAYAGGFEGGRHGNLHDSDPFVPRDRAQFAAVASTTTVTASGAFARTTLHDRVTFSGYSGEWVVVAHTSDRITLDRPTPVNGVVSITVMSDQRNYAVSFSRVVP